MKGKRLLLFLTVACAFTGAIAALTACTEKAVLSFDDGSAITMNIGDTKMLPFTVDPAQTVEGATLTTSDDSVVGIVGSGYIRGIGAGTAEVTLSAEGIASTATISVTVTVPQVRAENRYVVNADSDATPNLYVQLPDEVPAGTKLYAEAEKAGNACGSTTVEVQPNRRAYVPLSGLGMDRGIYSVGLTCVGYEDVPMQEVYLTDTVSSWSLVPEEDWTFYNAEISGDGTLSMVNEATGHGGASIVLDIEERADGSLVNPYIQVRAESGAVWSVKLRRGDGLDSTYEEVVLGDTAVSATSQCTIDLNEYSYYVRGGQVTLVIYAVQDDLRIADIINYAGENVYEAAVRGEDYTPLESVEITAPEKVRVGSEYSLNVRFEPADATFKNYSWVAENDNVRITQEGKLLIVRPGACKVSCVGYDGTEYGSVVLNGTIAVTDLVFEGTAGEAVADVSDGSYDLSAKLTVLPEDASDKRVRYTVVSSTAQGAAVDEETGLVTFGGPGEIVIRAIAADNTSVTEEFRITVADGYVPVRSVEIGGDVTQVRAGDSVGLSAAVQPADATYPDVLWRVSDENVAVMEGNTLRALRAGSVTVYAYSRDGAAYDSVTIDVRAYVLAEIAPTSYGYGSLELGSEIISGDVVTLTAKKGEDEVTLAVRTIGEAEQDVNGRGSMDAQRRILFSLDDALFAESGKYTFEITVARGGEALLGYSFGKLTFGKTAADITAGEWRGVYQAAPSAEGGVTVTLTGEGFGNIAQTVQKSQIGDARYLLVSADSRTCDRIAVKFGFADGEVTMTSGDNTSLGVFKFDLNDASVVNKIAAAESFDVCLYAIGRNGTTATFGRVIFVSEDISFA